MPQSVKQKIDPENLCGLQVDDSDPELLREAIEHALHYRGDVTVQCRDGADPVTGYLFDCRTDESGELKSVRLLPEGLEEPCTVAFHRIARLHVSGRDTAAGKSWETWVRKYIERKTVEANDPTI